MITGPGNIYVAAAKRLLRDRVAIDAEAGPTEIAIVADDGAEASFIAADLVAQAEHDPLARLPAGGARVPHWPTGWTSSWRKRPLRRSTPSGCRPRWPGSRPA